MSVHYWEGGVYTRTYTNGTHEPVVGETLTGATSGFTAIVINYDNAGGWAGAGTGTLYLASPSGTFVAEELQDPDTNDVCDIAGALTDVKGDWSEAENWNNDSVPVADDEVVFNGRGNAVDGVIYDVVDGIAVGETGGVSLDLLHVRSTFTGNIGLTAERLHINPDRFIYESDGEMWLECSEADAVTDSNIDSVLCNSLEGTLHLSSDVNSDAWTAQFTDIIITQGTLAIEDNTNVDTLRIPPESNRKAAVTVTIGIDCFDDKDADTPMTIYMENGNLTTDSAINQMFMNSGTVNYGTDLVLSPETGMDITELRQAGGVFNWNPDDSGNDAFVGILHVYGGVFDASGTTNKNRAKKLGNGAGKDIFIYQGAILNIANGMGNITMATSTQLFNYGGTFTTDPNTQIIWLYDQP